jgi:hypothetical protein
MRRKPRHAEPKGNDVMPAEMKKVSRILVMRIKLPSAEAIKSLSMMMKSSAPFYQASHGAKMRLLRNVDAPTEVVQIVEYQAEETMESNRQKLASDPMARTFVQAWRTMFPAGFEMDVYEDVTDR